MLGGLHNCQSPSLFAGGHKQGIGPGEQCMLIVLGHLAAEAHAIADAVFLGIGTQVSLPPTGAYDIQDRARGLRHRIHGMLNLLMRHQARERYQVHVGLSFQGRHMVRNRVQTIGNDVRTLNSQCL